MGRLKLCEYCRGERCMKDGRKYCPKCDTFEKDKWETIKKIIRRFKK